MKVFISFFAFLSFSCLLQAQNFPELTSYPFGDSGFEIALPDFPGSVSHELSDESDEVWRTEMFGGGFDFGVICVKFAKPIGYDPEDNLALLKSYLDYLKEPFDIKVAEGYKFGSSLRSTENAVGISDYWLDHDSYSYVVQGWVSNSYLAVLYIGADTEDPHPDAAHSFLNSLRFPSK